jgi:prephenate dehydrogenase
MSGHNTTVAVFGPGLMGGSLLMALRDRHPGMSLRVWGRREEALQQLRDRGLADFSSTDAAQTAQGADIAVLCVPVDKLAEVAAAAAPGVGPECAVTDVGSVKANVVAELERIFWPDRNFVGSHPMCGSEAAGLGAARADLYDTALCVVTPTAASRPEATRVVEDFWRAAGMRTISMPAAAHDRAAAVASHVPHVAAAVLVNLLEDESPEAAAMCAGGFRDTTRVASGSPELWTAILSSNRAEVIAALGKLGDSVAAVRTLLEREDTPALRDFLARAAARRGQIPTTP